MGNNILLIYALIFFNAIAVIGQNQLVHSCKLHNEIEKKVDERCLQALNQSNSKLVPENQYPKILQDILNASGLSSNFPIYRCNGYENASASVRMHYRIENDTTVFDYLERYFLVDFDWINKIGAKKEKWIAIGIMAHEIGHMANNHHFVKDGSNSMSRIRELEADYFAGFTLYKLGASLTDAKQFILSLPKLEDDRHTTHPSTEKRLMEVIRAYKNAKSQNIDKIVLSEDEPRQNTNNGPKETTTTDIEDCATNNTGDICFINKTAKTLAIYFDRGKYEYTPKLIVAPFEEGCLYDLPVKKPIRYEIAKVTNVTTLALGTISIRGNLKIEKCQTKTKKIR